MPLYITLFVVKFYKADLTYYIFVVIFSLYPDFGGHKCILCEPCIVKNNFRCFDKVWWLE